MESRHKADMLGLSPEQSLTSFMGVFRVIQLVTIVLQPVRQTGSAEIGALAITINNIEVVMIIITVEQRAENLQQSSHVHPPVRQTGSAEIGALATTVSNIRVAMIRNIAE
jgi:hypothetical protein